MEKNPVLELFKVPESNVLLMTRFRETEYHAEISAAVADATRAFGLEFVRADSPNWSATTLWDSVRFCLDACRLGVAVFEMIDEDDFNPNVSFELGQMLALGRKCLVLKEKRLKSLSTDLCGHLYKEFDSHNIRQSILSQMADWLQEIGVRKRDGEKMVVFVSAGGTCRCAIGKAILTHFLGKAKQPYKYRIESRAIWEPTLSCATQAARAAIQEIAGEDLLLEHRPRRAGPAFLFESNLILATDRAVLNAILASSNEYPGTEDDKLVVEEVLREKSFLATEFFGSTGNISDPWPDEGDAESLQRYRACAKFWADTISAQGERLPEFLSKSAPNKALKRTVAFGARRLSP